MLAGCEEILQGCLLLGVSGHCRQATTRSPYPPVEETAGERRPPRREAAAALVCRCICGPLPNPPPALRWRGEGGARWQCRDVPPTHRHISTLPPHPVGGAGHSVRAANAQNRAAPPSRLPPGGTAHLAGWSRAHPLCIPCVYGQITLTLAREQRASGPAEWPLAGQQFSWPCKYAPGEGTRPTPPLKTALL
jgi:hypothetical protein